MATKIFKINKTLLVATTVLSLFIAASNQSYAQNTHAHPTLSDILRHVAESNPTLQAAREELNATKELSPQARAGWLPSLSAETSLFATDIDNSNFGAGTGATTKDFSVNLDQPIFRGGRTFAEKARAEDLIRAGEALLKQYEQDIFLRTAIAYSDLFRDAQIWTLRQQNENNLKTELEAAQERYELGDITITDVHQAQVRYQRAQSSVISALSDLEVSEARFFELTQMLPAGLSRPTYNFPFPNDLETMISIAESNSPEIWMAQYEFEAQEHNSDAILRELFPQISAFADYNKQYDPQPGIIDQSETQTIGVRATLALYEGGATRSRIRESKKTSKQRWYQIQEVKNRIRQETTSNWKILEAMQNITFSREKEIEAAKLALDGVRTEAQLGQRTMLDVLDADDELINAQIGLVRARRDEAVSKFSLAANLGMLTQNLQKLY